MRKPLVKHPNPLPQQRQYLMVPPYTLKTTLPLKPYHDATKSLES